MEPVTIFLFGAAAAALVVGVCGVVIDRRSVAWRLLLLCMTLVAMDGVLAGFCALTEVPEFATRWQGARLLVTAFAPVSWLLFTLTYARENRQDSVKRWSLLLAFFAVVPVALTVVGFSGLVTDCIPAEHAGGECLVRLGWSGRALHIMAILAGVTALANLERTFRSAVGTMRWRVKFVIIGAATILAVRVHTSALALLYSSVHRVSDVLNGAAVLLGGALAVKGLLRSRTGQIDLYVSHSVLYRSATVLLSGCYLLIVGAMEGVLGRMGVVGGFPLLALLVFIGVVGLGVLLSSDRIRLKTNRFVSRHFKRPQYDYRRVWTRFSDASAGLMDRREYCRSVVRLVSETFEALSVTIWLTGPGRDRLVFGVSTSLPAGSVAAEPDGAGLVRDALKALREARKPFDIETPTEKWAVALREWNPVSFQEKGGHRIAVPLVAGDGLVGVMVVGDRVVGVPFSTEEMDLLGVIAGQVQAGLANMDLSERLVQMRELEAFQTMSAFFVHDLKNTASTLSLMLENMPRHFNDPSFREDAIKGIAKSVSRIETLIRRLTALRQRLDIRPAETDLNGLVRNTLTSLGEALASRPVLDLGRVPAVFLDHEQMEKVLTNLLLNAREASGPGGEIRVGTRMDDKTVVLEVSDRGCGMSRSFIEESLFRPFRSTKKDGMGIGLFQSKMIVEAHGGKIDVKSEEGVGSTFSVRLPAGRGGN